MTNKLKHTKMWEVRVGAILLTIGAFMILVGAYLFIGERDYILNGARNINKMIRDKSLKANEFTEITVDASFGVYAETEHTICGFIPAGKEKHYIIWREDGSLISLAAKSKKTIEELEDIVEQTEAYVNGNSTDLSKSITLSGRVKILYGELRTQYDEALDYLGVDSGADVYIIDIDTTDNRVSLLCRYGLMIVIGLFLTVVAIFYLKKLKKKENNMEAVQDVQTLTQEDSNYYNSHNYMQ